MKAKATLGVMLLAVVLGTFWFMHGRQPGTSIPVVQEPAASRHGSAAPTDGVARPPSERLQAGAAPPAFIGRPHPGRRDQPPAVAPNGASPDNTTGEDAESIDEAYEYEATRRVVLGDPDPDERASAIQSLGAFGDERSLPVLREALHDADQGVRLAAVEELAFANDAPLDLLRVALEDSDPEVRAEAVRILGTIETPPAQALIRQALQDRDEDVRVVAELYAADDLDADEGE